MPGLAAEEGDGETGLQRITHDCARVPVHAAGHVDGADRIAMGAHRADHLQRHVLATLPHPIFGEFRGRDFRKALKKTENLAIRDYVNQLADLAGECAARIHRHFSTEVIALSGGLLDEMADEILARAQASFNRNSSSLPQPPPTLIASRLGDLAPITGAAIWSASQPSALPGPLVATV